MFWLVNEMYLIITFIYLNIKYDSLHIWRSSKNNMIYKSFYFCHRRVRLFFIFSLEPFFIFYWECFLNVFFFVFNFTVLFFLYFTVLFFLYFSALFFCILLFFFFCLLLGNVLNVFECFRVAHLSCLFFFLKQFYCVVCLSIFN